MTSVRTRSRGLVKATGLLLASLIALPSAADDHDQAQAAMDGVAYQLRQLLNQNEELTNEIAGLRGQVEELLDDAQRSRESQLKIAADFDNRIGTIESKPDVDNSEEKARITCSGLATRLSSPMAAYPGLSMGPSTDSAGAVKSSN